MFKKKQTKQQDNRKEIIEMSDQLKNRVNDFKRHL